MQYFCRATNYLTNYRHSEARQSRYITCKIEKTHTNTPSFID